MRYPKLRIVEKCIKEEISNEPKKFIIFYLDDGEEKVLRVQGDSEEFISNWFYQGLPQCKIKEIKEIIEEEAPEEPIYTYKLK